MTREQTALVLGQVFGQCLKSVEGTPRAAAVQRMDNAYFRAPVQGLRRLHEVMGNDFPPSVVELLGKLDVADLEAMDGPGRPLPAMLEGWVIIGYYKGRGSDD